MKKVNKMTHEELKVNAHKFTTWQLDQAILEQKARIKAIEERIKIIKSNLKKLDYYKKKGVDA